MPTPEGAVYRSHTTSLLVKGRAVVPTSNRDPAGDEAVLDACRRVLPEGWQLATVDASGAIGLGGAVHCAALELRGSAPVQWGAEMRYPSCSRWNSMPGLGCLMLALERCWKR